MTLLYVPLHLRMLDTYEGAGDLATGPLEEMIALSQNRADRQGEAFAIRALAEYYLVAGQASLAYQCLAAFLARPSIQEWEWLTLYALPYQAWAELELGQVEQAALTSQDCVIRNMAESYNQLLVDALRVRALIAIRQEHYQEAASDLDEAIALCQVMPYPYAEAKALWVYGQLEANRGDLQAAHERFIAALAICDQLGEGLYRPHIERALKNGAAAPL